MKRLTATVHGRVQGVAFRYHTMLTARRLGATGWVRNERDGTVSIAAEGDDAALQALLAFLRQGPPAARVTRVETDWSAATGEFSNFQVMA